MESFMTATRNIKISYYKDEIKEREEEIESKIIISTTAKTLDDVSKISNVRIYFLVNEDGKENNLFEFDPFCNSITINKMKKYFLITKTLSNLKVKQEIKINKQNNDEKMDDLDNQLADLIRIKN